MSFRDDNWKDPHSRVELIELATSKVLLSIANPEGEFGKLAIAADGSVVAALTGNTVETPFDENGLSGVRIKYCARTCGSQASPTTRNISSRSNCLGSKTWSSSTRIASPRTTSNQRSESGVLTPAAVSRSTTYARKDLRSASAAGVAVESWQNTVCLIDLKSGKPLHAFDGHRCRRRCVSRSTRSTR